MRARAHLESTAIMRVLLALARHMHGSLKGVGSLALSQLGGLCAKRFRFQDSLCVAFGVSGRWLLGFQLNFGVLCPKFFNSPPVGQTDSHNTEGISSHVFNSGRSFSSFEFARFLRSSM